MPLYSLELLHPRQLPDILCLLKMPSQQHPPQGGNRTVCALEYWNSDHTWGLLLRAKINM